MVNASPAQRQRAFLLEFNSYTDWDSDALSQSIALAKSAGFRTFAATRSSAITATVEDHLRLYNNGFDVAYTYNLTNAVEARQIVNLRNNITPP